MKLFLLVIGATFALAYAKPAARAQSDEFYSGKTVRIIVGYASGGGHDFYARLLARYMGKYVPGNPALIVENMPGAGELHFTNLLSRTV
jgi:tripartite-type tricarboxylate transporter receptor subunit TctC